jgi:Zn-dependent peptidase ImmA (M78 family)
VPSIRESSLRGAMEAARLHRELGIQPKVGGLTRQIDVVKAIHTLDVPLLFRPLHGLLGAYVTYPRSGILVTTERPRSVQRLTAAHELGHHYLNHTGSLDSPSTILDRSTLLSGRGQLIEIEADSFASEFLMPVWLLRTHVMLHKWQALDLANPIVVYQLSLRLGVSYQAACVALTQHRLIAHAVQSNLLEVQPKLIKQRILGKTKLKDWHADVWLLDSGDWNGDIYAGSEDVFVFNLNERTASGYLWNTADLDRSGFVTLANIYEASTSLPPKRIGGSTTRQFVVQSIAAQNGTVRLKHARPWESSAKGRDEIVFGFSLSHIESGLSRFEKQQLLKAA